MTDNTKNALAWAMIGAAVVLIAWSVFLYLYV